MTKQEEFKPKAMSEWERIDLQRKVEKQKSVEGFKQKLSQFCQNYCVNNIRVEFYGSGDDGSIESCEVQFDKGIITKYSAKETIEFQEQAIKHLANREHDKKTIPPTTKFDWKNLTGVVRDYDWAKKRKLTDNEKDLHYAVYNIIVEKFMNETFKITKQKSEGDTGTPVEIDRAVKVSEAIDDWCYDQLEITGYDWYNNDGGSGNFEFNDPKDPDAEVTLELSINRMESDDYQFDL